MSAPVVVVLGATGRLGPAVLQAFEGWERRGLSWRAPLADEARPELFVRAERSDEDALRELADGATVVVDLLAFDEEDAWRLLRAVAGCESPPTHLVFASSVAEHEPKPHDVYGAGKLAARRRYEADFPGPVHTLVLPRLVASRDPNRREQPYLDSAVATGRALVSGSGEQRQTMAPVEGVARVVRWLAEDPTRLASGPLNVGPPEPVPVNDAVRALLEGAGLESEPGRHPDRSFRGPHGGADEVLDSRRLHERFDPAWPDPRQSYRALGAWLVAHAEGGARPRPLVKKAHRAFARRRLVDVHGVRREPVLEEPLAELAELAGWLSPAFYVDLGRPCNAACIYCAVPPHGDTRGFAPLSELEGHIEAGVAAGCQRAILIGGEPTIHPQLEEVLGRLLAVGLREHVVMTNGRRLADAAFLDRLVALGVRTFHVSIDTVSPELYRRVSRVKGAPDASLTALDHILARPDLQLYVYACVGRFNAEHLEPLMDELIARAARAGRSAPPLVMAFAKPIGDSLVHAADVLLSAAERRDLARRLAHAASARGLSFGFRNLQACLAPELAPRVLDNYLEDYSIDLDTGAAVSNAHAEASAFEAGCASCARRESCPGIYAHDLMRDGVDIYRPLQAGR